MSFSLLAVAAMLSATPADATSVAVNEMLMTPEDALPAESAKDIIVTARPHSVPGDPIAAINAKSQSVDKAVVGPLANAYRRSIPEPVHDGTRNILNNLHEPVICLNFLIQFKPGRAAETVARFAINSTLGAAGLVDVAKRRPFKLPLRRNGFANTLGYYGVKPGPFFYLPLIGPTTLRDLIGNNIDRAILPTFVGRPFNRISYVAPAAVLTSLNNRIEFDQKLNEIRDASSDAYTASRVYYLQQRQAEIDGLHSRKR